MSKFIKSRSIIIMILLTVFAFTGCGEAKKENIVLPPVRESRNVSHTALRTRTIEEYLLDADAIVRLKIGNWIGEDTYEYEADEALYFYYRYTYYQAEVIDVYYGECPSNIILRQIGNSTETIDGFPLFTYGEEMILFIYHSPKDTSESFDVKGFDKELVYGLIGMNMNVWNVASDNNGEAYVIPSLSVAVSKNLLTITENNLTNYGSASEDGITQNAAQAALALHNTDTYDSPGYTPAYVYKLGDFTKYLDYVVSNTQEKETSQ